MGTHKTFWKLAWPAAAEGLLLMLLTAADLQMVSALGTRAVAAVGIFSQPRMAILCLTRSYSVALSAYVARLRGQDADYPLTSCTRASLIVGVCISFVVLILTWICVAPLLQLAGVQEDYLAIALQYARPALVSLAFSGPAIVLHGILIGLGDTRSVLIANVVGNGLNVLLNAILIHGVGPFPALGVLGAGISTAIGTGVTLVFTLSIFLDEKQDASLRGCGPWLPQKEYQKMIVPFATGVFFEQAAERFGMFSFARLVAGLGTASLGVHNICSGLCDIYYSFAQGLGKASLVQVGQAFGGGQEKQLNRIVMVSRRAALWTGGAATLFYFVLRVPLLRFYHLKGDELFIGSQIMLFVAVISIPEVWAMIHAGMLRGMGHTGFVATYSLISIAIIRPILTYILIYPLGLGVHGAWVALSIDQSSRAICSHFGMYKNIRQNEFR